MLLICQISPKKYFGKDLKLTFSRFSGGFFATRCPRSAMLRNAVADDNQNGLFRPFFSVVVFELSKMIVNTVFKPF